MMLTVKTDCVFLVYVRFLSTAKYLGLAVALFGLMIYTNVYPALQIFLYPYFKADAAPISFARISYMSLET